MRKNNTRVTRPEQYQIEAALRRRAKRKEAKALLLAPYRKLLIARDEQLAQKDEKIAELIKQAQELTSQAKPTEVPNAE